MNSSEEQGESSSARSRRRDPLLLLLNARQISGTALGFGVILTFVFHALAWLAVPEGVFHAEASEVKNPYRDYVVELEDPEEEEQSYTQTNPDAPDNEPDETDRFAARNQQAANPEVPEELDPDNRPASESEDSIETDQFITGNLFDPLEALAPQQEAEENPQPTQESPQPEVVLQEESQPLKKEIPILGSEIENDPDETGIADYEFEKDLAPTNLVELVEGEAEEGDDEQVEQQANLLTVVSPDISQEAVPSPRPRPKLPNTPPGPVRNNPLGVSRTGSIGVDAKFSEFGEYMERFIEAVSVRWNSLAQERAGKESNSMVRLTFILTKDGYIDDLTLTEKTAKAIGVYVCRAALESGEPYGPWTPEMVEVFGDSEEVTFTFYYR